MGDDLDLLVSGEEPISGAFGGNGKTVTGRKPLGKGLSSYQLFRAALDFLGKSGWVYASSPMR